MNPSVEPDPSSSRSRNLDYSPELNLFILELVAKDRGPEMWAYRYKKAPTAPARTELHATTEPGKVALAWSGPARDVYRAQAERAWEAGYVKIATARDASFVDAGLEAGKTYFYRVGSGLARTQPRVLLKPTVAVQKDRVEVGWNAHPAKDVAGYNLYRGVASVATVKKGSPGAWKDNDPEYAEPQVVSVRDISKLTKLNGELLTSTSFVDRVDWKGSGEYAYAVYAYVVRAVNRMGTESGPSPYALTIAAEPENVLLRETGAGAEIKWDPVQGAVGYLVYQIADQNVARITPEPVRATSFTHSGKGLRRYCVLAVDALGQEGQPSSPVWCQKSYAGFFPGDWHQ
jgi:hypothetical protein